MKKLLALLLALVFVFTFAACGPDNTDDGSSKLPDKTPEELISEGNYFDAYRVLLAKGDAAAKAELEKFVWLPAQTVETDFRGNTRTATFTWDAQNRPIKVLGVQGERSVESTYTYGDKTYSFFQNGALREKVDLNEAGKIIKISRPNSDGDMNTEEYFYDEKGNLIKIIDTIIGNDEPSINTYTYDEAGRCLTEKSGTEWWGSLETYTYDADGKLIKEVTQNMEHGVPYSEYISVFTYNENGLLVKEEREEINNGVSEGTNYRCTFTYDENGRPATMLKDYMNDRSDSYEWTYDTYGNLTKEKKTEKNGTTENISTIEHKDYKVVYMPNPHAVMEEVLASFQPDLD